MASGFFAILDDIAVLMDDVAVLSKVAAKNTAGILGDDLAVNAEKASGFASSREIPVLWEISKGSFYNKLIILPIAFLLTAFYPPLVTIVLVLGGIYLAYEGAEKIYEFFVPHHESKVPEIKEAITEAEILEIEKERVKSAIVTDFILSVEIIIIALGSVVGQPLVTQIMVVSIIAVIATVGVYGIVALIVRMDEAGYALVKKSKNKKGFLYILGNFLINALPWVIKGLGIVGTLALLLVSGGIFAHNIDVFHHFLPMLPPMLGEFILGLLIGLVALLLHSVYVKMTNMIKK